MINKISFIMHKNDRYIVFANQVLAVKSDFTLDDPDTMFFDVFRIYNDLGLYVDVHQKDKDSEFFMTFFVLCAGFGVENFSDWEEYNMFKK